MIHKEEVSAILRAVALDAMTISCTTTINRHARLSMVVSNALAHLVHWDRCRDHNKWLTTAMRPTKEFRETVFCVGKLPSLSVTIACKLTRAHIRRWKMNNVFHRGIRRTTTKHVFKCGCI